MLRARPISRPSHISLSGNNSQLTELSKHTRNAIPVSPINNKNLDIYIVAPSCCAYQQPSPPSQIHDTIALTVAFLIRLMEPVCSTIFIVSKKQDNVEITQGMVFWASVAESTPVSKICEK